jgi:hypothetical protein
MSDVSRTFVAVLLTVAAAACARENDAGMTADSAAPTIANNPIAWAFDAPQGWDDRVTMEDESVAPGALHQSARAFLYIPADTSVRPQALLAVLVYDAANWARMSSEPGPPPGDTIMTAAGRVYVASLPQSNPFEGGSRDAVAFDSMSVDIGYVRRAFRRLPE